ncbi:hypothetical protein Plhal304r1_c080g0165801 [Plasmopara halstedii]
MSDDPAWEQTECRSLILQQMFCLRVPQSSFASKKPLFSFDIAELLRFCCALKNATSGILTNPRFTTAVRGIQCYTHRLLKLCRWTRKKHLFSDLL